MDNEQLPKGYKNTEVGVIPVEWEIVSFETIADKSKKWSITGGPFGSNLKASDYTDDGIQIIQLQNIGDGEFIDDYQIFTSDTKANELISCNIYPGEIILSKMGDPVARACFIPNKAKRFVMASDGIRLVVNERDFSKKFIHDYINSIYFRKRAFEISTGSTRLRIGLPELKSLLVIKPSKSEQTAIATALSDADALINSLEKLIAKKRNIKQGAMQQLLKPKEGWEVKKLGEIAAFFKGKGLPKSHLKENGKYKCIHYGELFTKYKESISSILSYTNENENCFFSISNDVLMPTSDVTPNGLATASCIKQDGIILGGDVLVIRILPSILDGLFLSFYVSQNREKVMKLVSGSTVYHLYGSDMKDFEISYPKTEEQNEIATILSDMDAEIQALETKLEKYRKIKLGMMQNLLTGKIRLI